MTAFLPGKEMGDADTRGMPCGGRGRDCSWQPGNVKDCQEPPNTIEEAQDGFSLRVASRNHLDFRLWPPEQ